MGANYPDWVMGPYDLGNGLFFSITVLTTTYLAHRLSNPSPLRNDVNKGFRLSWGWRPRKEIGM